ncbi:MAG TPA: cupin domain-containing protein [Gaiellaceae bacterium]|jgi:mannose-6-phosphate isomerase-like protein (cupin superfamily)
MHRLITATELARSGSARRFEGEPYGAGLSFFLVDSAPGRGPDLHVHEYEGIFIVEAGNARFAAGDETLDAGPGDVVVVGARTPHRFQSSGGENLRMVAIHHAPAIVTTWLEGDQGAAGR